MITTFSGSPPAPRSHQAHASRRPKDKIVIVPDDRFNSSGKAVQGYPKAEEQRLNRMADTQNNEMLNKGKLSPEQSHGQRYR
jgi:autotransporter adhesin